MKKKLFLAVAVILLITSVFSVLSVTALSINDDYNYSLPGSAGNTEMTSVDFMTDVLGLSLSDAESTYLTLYSDFSLSHIASVPTSYITTEFDEGEGTLKVLAYEYSYIAENGVRVVWTPTFVSCRGERKELLFDGNKYTAEYSYISVGEDNSVKIDYNSEFEISSESVNSFLNLAYNDAVKLKEEIAEKEAKYEEAKKKYEADLSTYNDYLLAYAEYQNLLVIYKEYLTAKRIYDEKRAEYETYLSEMGDYNDAKEKYDKYVSDLEKYNSDYEKYQAYLDFLKEYEYQIKAYEEYASKIEKIKSQLAVIEATKTPVTSLKRTVYDAIMGNTVTSVIENKELITSELVKADGVVVDLAGEATENLRVLLSDYFSITTESGKYSYYIQNYEAFRDNFVNLLKALDKLYLVKRVRATLIAQEKQEKYLILVAQLYCIANALSDEPVMNYDGKICFDSSYYVGKGYNDQKKPVTILGSIYIPDTNSAAPIEGGYPAFVEKPEYTVVPEPVKPAPVKLPVQPTPVSDPGAPPSEVSEPTEPELVEDPGVAPNPYTPPEGAEDIISEYEDGTLVKREELSSSVSLVKTVSSVKKFFGAQNVSVVYFDLDGTLLYRTEVESGTFADYSAALPTKEEDMSAVYEFAGWRDREGEEHDLTCVSEDLTLYPVFNTVYKKYPITWNIDGASYTEEVTWGILPECPVIPSKENNDSKYYIFDSWDNTPVPVDGEAVYTAVFEGLYIVPYQNGGGAEVSLENGVYNVFCHTSIDDVFDISKLLEFSSGNAAITLHTVNGTLAFSYAETLALKASGVESVSVSSVQRGTKGYVYSFFLKNADGGEINSEFKASFAAPCNISDKSHLSLYYTKDGNGELVRYSEDKNSVVFTAISGVTYYATLEYSVTVIKSELLNISVDKYTASPGDRITVELAVPDGVVLDGLYVINSEGEKEFILGRTLTMPAAELRIGVEAHYIRYTVKFLSEGKIIAQNEYKYGDIPTPPEPPKKATDTLYSYEFSGWSSEISPVTSDMEYTAIFTKMPVEKKPDSGNIKLPASILKLILLGVSVAAVFGVGILPASVMYTVVFIKRKKQIKLPKNSTRDTEEPDLL